MLPKSEWQTKVTNQDEQTKHALLLILQQLTVICFLSLMKQLCGLIEHFAKNKTTTFLVSFTTSTSLHASVGRAFSLLVTCFSDALVSALKSHLAVSKFMLITVTMNTVMNWCWSMVIHWYCSSHALVCLLLDHTLPKIIPQSPLVYSHALVLV